jgi:threonine-phosphate decarboxylase
MVSARISQTGHGGAAIRLARELGLPLTEILDFSASINPLGVPVSALDAAHQALDDIVHYPEIDAASLVVALAGHHSLPTENLLAANGSTELIYLLPRILRARRALIVTPAFSEYEKAMMQVGVPVDSFALSADNNFRFDPEALLATIDDEVDLVVVANPGNPTAAGIDPDLLIYMADRLAGRAALVVDEAFVDFAPQLSLIAAVPKRENLYILRSMTKFYAIPGLRIGYLAGPEAAIRLMRQALPPWTINTPALQAAIACLQDSDYQQQTRTLIPQLRQDLADGLSSLGFTLFASVANYLLVQLPKGRLNAEVLTKRLTREGILIRDCTNFSALDDRYIRLAVRTADENRRLLTALRQVMTQAG